MIVLKKRSKTQSALFFRSLNPEVKTAFKMTCVRRSDTMQDVIESLMRLYITNPSAIEKELKATKLKHKRIIK